MTTNQLRTTLHRSLAISMIVFCCAVALRAQTPEWKSYSYPSDGFRASYPSEPKLGKQPVPTNSGTFELRTYPAEDGSAVVTVMVCDYGAVAANQDPDAVLERAKNGALENIKARQLNKKIITLGVYHGVEFEGVGDTWHAYARYYMVGTTLIQTVVLWPVAEKRYPGAERFLDSFQVIPRIAN